MPLGADVLIVLRVPFKVGASPGSVVASGLVEHRNVRRDLAFDQPTEKRPGAICSVGDQALWVQIKLLLHPVQHGLGRSNLGLPDRAGRFHVNYHAVVCVDQVVVRIAKECRPFACRRPLALGIGMGCELRLHFAGRAECSLIQRVELLTHGAGRIRRVDVRSIPLFLWGGVLFVRIRLDQAGINCHALATDQTFFDAPRNGHLKQMTQ